MSTRDPVYFLSDFDNQPSTVIWREESDPHNPDRKLKVPYNGKTGHKAYGEHSTWGGTYKSAKAHAKRLLADGATGGLGILIGTSLDGYVVIGIDFDACRDPEFGTIAPWARRFIKRLPATYTDISPSATGLKLFALITKADWRDIRSLFGRLPNGNFRLGRSFKRKAKLGGKSPGVEIYIGARFFAYTGLREPGSPKTLTIVTADDLRWLIETAGPNFVDGDDSQQNNSHGGWRDKTESGLGWRMAVEAVRNGKSFEEYLDELEGNDEVARWREDERQVTRAYRNAEKKVEAESSELSFDDERPSSPLRLLQEMNKTHAVVILVEKQQ